MGTTSSAGRPTKLNDQVQTALCRLLASGTTVEDACAQVGIDDNTYYRWRKRGRVEQERLDAWPEGRVISAREASRREAEAPYAAFWTATTQAQAEARVSAAIVLRQAMLPHDVVTESTETFSEMRVDQVTGQPYEYTRTVTRRQVTHLPGDWRAALEYLKRRDSAHWSERVTIGGVQDTPPIPISFLQPVRIDSSQIEAVGDADEEAT